MPTLGIRVLAALWITVFAGCATSRAAGPMPPVPPPAAATGPLDITVVYPRLLDTGVVRRAEGPIASRDSTFIFGSVGRGDANLWINGHRVAVYPTGGWLAWIPLPDDTVTTFSLLATAGGDTARFRFAAALPSRFRPPVTGAWIDTTSFAPTGDRWVRPGEGVRLAIRAAPGSEVAVVLADTLRIPLIADTVRTPRPWGEVAFGTREPPPRAAETDRYTRWWTGPLGPDPGPALSPLGAPHPADSAWALVEAVRDGDTVRARWPLRLGLVEGDVLPVVVVDDDTAATGDTDSSLAGRPAPWGTYHWFFPTGTRAAVSGRWNDQIRLQLSAASVAWVDATDVQPLAPGAPAPGLDRVARSPRLTPDSASVTLRVPLTRRIPFRVDEAGARLRLTLYGVAADMDWIQYGGTDPFVELIAFAQPTADATVVTVDLQQPVWGYRTRWDDTDLLLEMRRPPSVDRRRPLQGRRVAIDPGHPPAGARGPTGVYEGDVTLAVSRKTVQLLEEAGAAALLVRPDTLPLGLVERLRAAEAFDAEVLVSIHANALPDGVNPFVNSGTSVYYFHPRSAPLARAVNAALVRQLGFRDLGFGRGDLALARPTWMPAVLAEGLFMMIPEQEAVLASEEGQWRYARGVVEGIEAFLRERARPR